MKTYFGNHFKKQMKPYAKKFRHLIKDIKYVLESFNNENAIYLSNQFYKIRFHSSDLPKGKNKSFRLIIFFNQKNNIIIPTSIYLKSHRSNIKLKEAKSDLDKIMKEID